MKKLNIFLTAKCNMSCRFCGSWESNSGNREIPYENLIKIIDEGKKFGFKYMSLSGGEPFLYKDINNVINYASDLGYWIEVTTNGTVLTEKNITLLKDKKIRIRLSIHSVKKDKHNKIMGGVAFDKLKESIKLLQDNHVYYTFGSTIYEENIDEIEDLAFFAFKNKSNLIRFQPVRSIYKAEDINLDEKFYQKVLYKIIDFKIKNKKIIELLKNEKNLQLNPLHIFTTRHCPAGSDVIMTIDTNYNLLPCFMIHNNIKIPSIKFNSALDFQKMLDLMKNFFNISRFENLKGKCKDCAFKSVCLGGCMGEKDTRNLMLIDEQPLCIYNILKDSLKEFDSSETKNIVQDWYNRYLATQQNKSEMTACMRNLPIWEINFDPKLCFA